ncbi:methyltransferase domain family protein [Penicillium cosmopolitanum]|uniref:Methyltransferase domain family protein n=1 Tax=Penicillium cosmopolitanum TaxID=1131564 RepID=A0A9X0BAN6_9EURO|nr:methyltransferase domain family protein [Penicillium cosmopolitanum]KAJ5397980.1 methyltransferase domain family protein [Penicillium cosmopolitanum]
MSFLTPLRNSTRQIPRSLLIRSTAASIHTSAPRFSLKESDKNRDDLPNIYETQKVSQVKRAKEGKGKWEPELASNSEADVKADRGEVEHDKVFQEWQEKEKARKAKAT